jgi:hypothetical protein
MQNISGISLPASSFGIAPVQRAISDQVFGRDDVPCGQGIPKLRHWVIHDAVSAQIKDRISSIFQTVTPEDNLIGFGAFPDFTQAHHVERDIGTIGASPRFLSPTICEIRRKPVSEICCMASIQSGF